MELASIIGFVSGTIFIVLSTLDSAGYDAAKALSLINLPSIMITVGGTVAATFISYPMAKLATSMKAMKHVFKNHNLNPREAIDTIINLANMARKEGLLSLEDAAQGMEDTFLQKGIMLIVDGTDPELVRSILETEIAYIDSRHGDVRGVWDFIGSSAPAWGMVGTLLGLVMMLQDMSDPDSLGPNMAIALITTLYGSLMANFIAIPVSNKLKGFSNDEILMKEVFIEGILSIQAGENPRIVEEKLKAFLSPALRDQKDDKGKSAGEE